MPHLANGVELCPMSCAGLRDSRFWAGLGPFKARFLLQWGMFTGTPFAFCDGWSSVITDLDTR
jgi:hypothetical protein